jgi:hypothetical protein
VSTADDVTLERAVSDLLAAWSDTADAWRDNAREAFAREHLHGLEWRGRHAARSLAELNALCGEARRRCI